MLKETISQQKIERDQLLARNYINREKISQAKKFLESDLIKAIIGPRRAGKSVFALLSLKGQNFAYLNFDDEDILKAPNQDELLNAMSAVYGQTKYLLFDEIQNLPNWELLVNKLHRRGYNVWLTGSNAKLLSKELATSLTGRHNSIEILPFNFREFLEAKRFTFKNEELSQPQTKGAILNYLEEFMQNGGFPEVTMKNLRPSDYLGILLESVLFKDVAKRYRIRFSQKVYELELYLLNNFASEISFRRLANALDFKSVVTVQKYLGYLEEAYLVLCLNRYSHKAGERSRAPKKIYLVDNGFITAKAVSQTPNKGKMMENLVFTELLKQGLLPNFDLFYYKTKNQKEVDFVIKEGLKIKTLIQVAYDLESANTEQREIKALAEASDELKCDNLTIITWDTEKTEKRQEKIINFIPLWKWLLN